MLEKFLPELRKRTDDDDALRERIAKQRGIAPEDVDLDEVVVPSGVYLRRVTRMNQRAADKRRRKGQRSFNRQVREGETRRETAEAITRVLEGPDTPMRRNIIAAAVQYAKSTKTELPDEVRAHLEARP